MKPFDVLHFQKLTGFMPCLCTSNVDLCIKNDIYQEILLTLANSTVGKKKRWICPHAFVRDTF